MSTLPSVIFVLMIGGSGTFGQEVAALKPATGDGAEKVVTLYHAHLLGAPFQVETKYRATCGRFLAVATKRIFEGAEPGLCESRVKAMEATAMCAWFGQDDVQLQASVDALVRERCRTPRVDGLERAMELAERWWWSAPIRSYVHGQPPNLQSVQKRMVSLRNLDEKVRMAFNAFGGDASIERGGLLVLDVAEDVPASRAGLKKGDVIVNVNARPAQKKAVLESVLREGRSVPFMYMRSGVRYENSWLGGVQGLRVEPLPERVTRQP